ncbi:MAG TPA: hypothetical protein VJ550_08795 [Geomonas sp.]|nr:hypothetical protein [Geomonas sp.]
MVFKYKLPKIPAQLLVMALTFAGLLSKVPVLRDRHSRMVSDEYFINLTKLFQQLCEEAKYNRLKLIQRDKVQQELTDLMRRFFHFLEAVGDEDDLLAIQETGIEMSKPRKKTANKTYPPLVTTSAGTGDQ